MTGLSDALPRHARSQRRGLELIVAACLASACNQNACGLCIEGNESASKGGHHSFGVPRPKSIAIAAGSCATITVTASAWFNAASIAFSHDDAVAGYRVSFAPSIISAPDDSSQPSVVTICRAADAPPVTLSLVARSSFLNPCTSGFSEFADSDTLEVVDPGADGGTPDASATDAPPGDGAGHDGAAADLALDVPSADGPCGHANQPCCGGSPPCVGTLTCSGSANPTCTSTPDAFVVACGKETERCCLPPAALCEPGLKCVGTVFASHCAPDVDAGPDARACGQLQGPCCATAPPCDPGLTCRSPGIPIPGKCQP